ncbi:MAG: hypothetical protein FWH55_08535 [Oscillospiraceae bacterium]|nr:hypothetical protein [Oscillospiraceae bacterium]
MIEKKYIDALNARLSPVSVTTQTREHILSHPTMYRGSVRVFIGRVYTDKEYASRNKVLHKKLP